MKEPKIGLALGSGSARGFAHLGVLKVLEEHNISIDFIAGSSMGALIGALYAAGQTIEDIHRMAKVLRSKYYIDFTVPKMGFIAGNRAKELIEIFTYQKNIEETTIPLAVIATDLIKGEKVIFKEGPICDAVRASISIPGVFVPVKMGDKLLVDGGVMDRIPVSVAKEMGADIVIGVDVSPIEPKAELHSIIDVMIQSIDILQFELVKYRQVGADVMIRPKVEGFSSSDFSDFEEIVTLGEQAALASLPAIKQLISDWKVDL